MGMLLMGGRLAARMGGRKMGSMEMMDIPKFMGEKEEGIGKEAEKKAKELMERLKKAEEDILHKGDHSAFNDLVSKFGLKSIEKLQQKSGGETSHTVDKKFDPFKNLIKEQENGGNSHNSEQGGNHLSFKSSNGSLNVDKASFHSGAKSIIKQVGKAAGKGMNAIETRLEGFTDNIITSGGSMGGSHKSGGGSFDADKAGSHHGAKGIVKQIGNSAGHAMNAIETRIEGLTEHIITSGGSMGGSHKSGGGSFDAHGVDSHHELKDIASHAMNAIEAHIEEFAGNITTSSHGAMGSNIDQLSENEQKINKNDIENNSLDTKHREHLLFPQKHNHEVRTPKLSGKRGHDPRKFRSSLRRQAKPGLSMLRGRSLMTPSKGSIPHSSSIGGSPLRTHDPVRERLGRKSKGTWKPLDVTRSIAKLQEERKDKIRKGFIFKNSAKAQNLNIIKRNAKDIQHYKEGFSKTKNGFDNILSKEEEVLKHIKKRENEDENENDRNKKAKKHNMGNKARKLIGNISAQFHTMENKMHELMKGTGKKNFEENADRYLREEHGKLGKNLQALDKLEKDGYKMDDDTKGFTHKARKVYDFMGDHVKDHAKDHVGTVGQKLKQYHPGEVVMQLLEQFSEGSMPRVANNATNQIKQTGNLLSNDIKGVGNKLGEKIGDKLEGKKQGDKLEGKKQGESSQNVTDPNAGSEKVDRRR
jgi:cation transport regulator ChaC